MRRNRQSSCGDDVFVIRCRHPNQVDRLVVSRTSGAAPSTDGNTDGRRADGADVKLIPTTRRSVTIAANCGPARAGVVDRRRRRLTVRREAAQRHDDGEQELWPLPAPMDRYGEKLLRVRLDGR